VRVSAIVWVLLTSCSRPPARPGTSPSISSSPSTSAAIPPPTSYKAATTGAPYGLRVEGGVVSFCDGSGARRLDPATGKVGAFERTCLKDAEPNTTCSGSTLDVTVRTPNLGPDDVIDVGGASFPLEGRVHDCALDGTALAVVTGSEVVLIDTAKDDETKVIDHGGGDFVSIGSSWVAWTQGSTLQFRRR